jgi:sulfite reductase alpha subunit-like flavoprotein
MSLRRRCTIFSVKTAFESSLHFLGLVVANVQHRFTEHGQDVVRFIDEGANFYNCGRASIARAIERTVCDGMAKTKGWTEEEVNRWNKVMKRR